MLQRALAEAGIAAAGDIPIPHWTPDLAMEFMDAHGIQTQVLSLSDPAVAFLPGGPARALAREVNEYAAELIPTRPTRFGALAALPLPDVAGAVDEVRYALDELGLDGVGVLSSYDGMYLGDPRMDPLLAEFDARGAYVMVHPATPPASRVPDLGIPDAIVEFTFETTRAVTNLVWKGALERFPRIRWSLSHAGGAVPFLAYRITGLAGGKLDPNPITWGALGNLYYDTAIATVRPAMQSLTEVAPLSHVLFGSDWPFTAMLYPPTGDPQPQLDDTFSPSERQAVDRTNALALFPRLAGVLKESR
jgi:predicted TIM-barrel fold metal-dependent hydrolase